MKKRTRINIYRNQKTECGMGIYVSMIRGMKEEKKNTTIKHSIERDHMQTHRGR